MEAMLEDSSEEEEEQSRESGDEAGQSSVLVAVVDELEKYLSKPDRAMSTLGPNGQKIKFDLLKWWKDNEFEFPSLSRMAKQCLAIPASSAGVERLFSKAGKQYNDLSKNLKDETLKHRLMAASNFVPAPPKYTRLKGGVQK